MVEGTSENSSDLGLGDYPKHVPEEFSSVPFVVDEKKIKMLLTFLDFVTRFGNLTQLSRFHFQTFFIVSRGKPQHV